MRGIKQFAYLGLLALVAAPMAFADSPGRSVMVDPHPAESRAEQKPSLAILGGLTDTRDGRGNSLGYGIEYGIQPYVPIGAAIELSGYVVDGTQSQATLTRTRLLAKANYNFGGSIPVIRNSYMGLGVGPVWDNVGHRSDIELGIAPQIGFDIPLSRSPYSLGANANYMFVGGAKPDVFALNGVAKYWF